MKKQSPKIINAKLASIWSKEKLRNIAPLRGGFAFKSEKFQNTGIPIVRISNIKFDGTVGGEFEYYSKIIPDEKFVLRGRSILLAMSGATTGKIAMLDSEEEYYQNQRVGYFQNTGEVDYEFISSVLQTKAFTNQLNAVLVAGAQPNISSKEIDSFEFCIPDSIDEQSAIGFLFRTLDTLLSSYKDNLVNYQSFKATMLSKMFPKAGQTVPEIRLDGFEGEWEKAKLKDVAHRVQGNDGRMDLPTLTISASGGWMNQIDRFSANIAGKEQKNYTLLKKGELSYNHGNSKLAKYGVVFELQEYEEALVPKVYHSFRVNQLADAKFIEIMFSTKIPDRELGKLISSGARMDGLLNISFDDFMNISIIIPTIKEQQAIGSYFSNLDNLINSYQEKISQLEILKKKLLQDMFI